MPPRKRRPLDRAQLAPQIRRAGQSPLAAEMQRELRVWTAPEEPGPEVTAVRDRYRRLWKRQPPPFSGWTIVPGPNDGPYRASWSQLFYELAPLTDASGEEP